MKKLLKPIKLIGKVIPGEKIGRTINFPTANLALTTLPPINPGVYLAVCRLAKNSYLGLAYYSPRHTFEVYLFDFNQDIYGRLLSVKLTHFLRPPKKVRGLLALKKLIQQDLASLDDQVILVNKKDQPIGIQEKIQAHLGSAQLHRAISVQLFNQKGELLIQQRAKTKKLFAGMWANTVCTDVRPYESYLQAARRRLKEEFGLTAKLKPMFKFFYTAPSGKSGSEREIDQVFVGLVSDRPQPNPKEIAAWKYISLKAAQAQRKTFAPWFQLILKKMLSSAIFKA
jgi:isopentenyl-diphosphate delta-isomerase